MVREPAWWDEMGQRPALPEPCRPAPRVRLEQAEFWSSAGNASEAPCQPVPSMEALPLDESFPPPNSHDRPLTSPSGVGATQGAPASTRPVVAPFRGRYADQPAMAPRVSMARYLRLNGMLQNEEDLHDGMELPQRSFRPRFSFVAERHLPMDAYSKRNGRSRMAGRNAG